MTHRPQPTDATRRAVVRRRMWVGFAVLVALGMRVLWMPLHLSQEGHCGPEDHVRMHVAECGHHASAEHGEEAHGHDHAGGHGHDDDHPDHCALDHAFELFVQRGPAANPSFDAEALALTLVVATKPRGVVARAECPERGPPPQRTARSGPPRGPPTVA